MKKLLRFLTLAFCLVGVAVSTLYAQQLKQTPLQFGLMKHILRDGQKLTLTYYLIDEMQRYIDQVLIEKIKPDVKTGKTTAKLEVVLASADEVNLVLDAVQKEAYQIVAFTPTDDPGTCTMWRLDPKNFGSRRFETVSISAL